MTRMVNLAVGQPWPYPSAGPGLQAIMGPVESGLSLTLAATVPDISEIELAALQSGPFRLAVATSRPISWIVLDAGVLTLDAPYARGITSPEHSRAMAEAAGSVKTWPNSHRGIATLHVIDGGIIRANRVFSLSRDWWIILADGIMQCPEQITRRAYHEAITAQQIRWPTPQLLARALITEQAGAV